MNLDLDSCFDGVDEAVIRRERAKARELRQSQWWRNKLGQGRCYYCGTATPAAELTMDHLVPVARGGLSSKNNVVTCCKSCNNKKKTMLPLEWTEYMDHLAGAESGGS